MNISKAVPWKFWVRGGQADFFLGGGERGPFQTKAKASLYCIISSTPHNKDVIRYILPNVNVSFYTSFKSIRKMQTN